VLEAGTNFSVQDLMTELGTEIKINQKEIQIALNLLFTEN
jgi:hypothetical protein